VVCVIRSTPTTVGGPKPSPVTRMFRDSEQCKALHAEIQAVVRYAIQSLVKQSRGHPLAPLQPPHLAPNRLRPCHHLRASQVPTTTLTLPSPLPPTRTHALGSAAVPPPPSSVPELELAAQGSPLRGRRRGPSQVLRKAAFGAVEGATGMVGAWLPSLRGAVAAAKR
jgi:hypothetical protein